MNNKKTLIIYQRQLKNVWKPYKVPKLRHILAALRVFKMYFTKFNKTKKKQLKPYLEYQAAYTIMRLEYLLKTHKKGISSIYIDDLLEDPWFFIMIFENLRQKQSNNLNKISIKEISVETLKNLANCIRYGKYKPKPIQQIYIPKNNGKDSPLKVISSVDRILQEAIYLILEPLFHQNFNFKLYRFTNESSYHTTLAEIHHYWPKVKWFIKLDINPHLDKYQHLILLNETFRLIKSYKLNWIINKFLKVGYVSFHNLQKSLLVTKSTLQNCTLDSLFCTVYFNLFDKHVKQTLLKEYNKAHIKQTLIKQYVIQNLKIQWKSIYKETKKLVKISEIEIRKLVTLIKSKSKVLKDIQYLLKKPLCKILKYIRYNNNLLFGFLGSKKMAFEILVQCAHWLKLYLNVNLNLLKYDIKHHKNGIHFLEYWIWHKTKSNFNWKNLKKITKPYLNFSVPLKQLILKFALKGFFHLTKWGKKKRFVGKRQDKWLFLKSDSDVIRKFNDVINEIKNYYAGSTQQHSLNHFWYLMKKSCALTLAHRNNKKSASWAFNKYGKELSIKNHKNKKIIFLKNPKSSSSKWFNNNRSNVNNILVTTNKISIAKKFTEIKNGFLQKIDEKK
jgi:hypothetical protein